MVNIRIQTASSICSFPLSGLFSAHVNDASQEISVLSLPFSCVFNMLASAWSFIFSLLNVWCVSCPKGRSLSYTDCRQVHSETHLIKIWPVEKSQWSRQVMITCWDRWCFDQQQLYRIVRYRKWQTGSPICPCSNIARMQRNLRENNCKYLMSF